MKSTVEALEGNKVKLSVTIDGEEFEKQIDASFKRIAREVRIPGFRAGKAPRRILEARIGVAAARGDALEHGIPEYYSDAVTEHEVDVIAQPEIEITAGEEEGDVSFEAIVEVRPIVTVGGYDSLRVTIDSPDVTDADIDERIENMREAHATLEDADRPAQTGDSVTIDITGSRDGEEIDGLVAEDYVYEVGSGTIVPELDEHLAGTNVDDEFDFAADHPDPDEEPVDFAVVVKAIQEKVLPEVDDEFAAEASEFETVEEWRADLRDRMAVVKRAQSQMQVQQKTAEALAALVDIEIPTALVDEEVRNRLDDMAMRLQAQGLGLDQYLAATGQDQEAFVSQLKENAEEGVRVDLGLRAIVVAEALEADESDIDEEIQAVADRVGEKPDRVRKQLERNGQMPAVRSDISKRKALEWLVENVELVDEEGNPIDRADLEPDTAETDGGDPATEDDE